MWSILFYTLFDQMVKIRFVKAQVRQNRVRQAKFAKTNRQNHLANANLAQRWDESDGCREGH
jgi:hypothetical protein